MSLRHICSSPGTGTGSRCRPPGAKFGLSLKIACAPKPCRKWHPLGVDSMIFPAPAALSACDASSGPEMPDGLPEAVRDPPHTSRHPSNRLSVRFRWRAASLPLPQHRFIPPTATPGQGVEGEDCTSGHAGAVVAILLTPGGEWEGPARTPAWRVQCLDSPLILRGASAVSNAASSCGDIHGLAPSRRRYP